MEYDFEDRSQVCAGCPCSGSPYVPARGKSDTRYFAVGGAPGETETEQRKAFVGPAGQLLTDIMGALALDPVYTNVLKRRPEGKRPSRSECFRCGLHLIEEMKSHQVVVILALGQTTFDFLQGDGALSVTNVHGLPIPMKRFGMEFIVVPTHDPGYVLRKGGINSLAGDEWLSDIEDYRQVVERES